jgi:hypothetical protein
MKNKENYFANEINKMSRKEWLQIGKRWNWFLWKYRLANIVIETDGSWMIKRSSSYFLRFATSTNKSFEWHLRIKASNDIYEQWFHQIEWNWSISKSYIDMLPIFTFVSRNENKFAISVAMKVSKLFQNSLYN